MFKSKSVFYAVTKGMDVDTSIAEEKDNGNNEIPKTQDDSLSVLDLDTIEVEMEEL